jgi:hypothetical protein
VASGNNVDCLTVPNKLFAGQRREVLRGGIEE